MCIPYIPLVGIIRAKRIVLNDIRVTGNTYMYEVSIKYVTVCLECIDFTFVYASSAISTENCSYDYTVGLRIMKTEFRCAVFENTLRNQVTVFF